MNYILDHNKAHQKYFEEMTKIPHGSFHEKAYSDYLCTFANDHGLRYKQDDLNNVIIWKPASAGYEDHAPLIIQAHMDMVCEKLKDSEFDFENDPLSIYVEEGYLKAKHTTLGADDGTGVAMMLAILEDDDAKHPSLECIFTVQEEVGLFGALALQKEDLDAKRMINLDDEGEASTCTTSAGGMSVIFSKERILVPCEMAGYEIEIKGLSGGHSGAEIHREKGNANKLMARLLFAIHKQYGIQMTDFDGGDKDNAIPRECKASFVSDASIKDIQKICGEMEKVFYKELEFSDPKITVHVKEAELAETMAIEDTEELMTLLLLLPSGVRHRSMSIDGLTTASSNLAAVHCDQEHIRIVCSLRGALESFVDTLADEMELLGQQFGFVTKQEARYPAWSYDEKSDMRSKLQETCRDVFGKELELKAVHGGLECGVFKALNADMDIVTMGPLMYDIHTPDERLDLESFDRTYIFLKAYLERL